LPHWRSQEFVAAVTNRDRVILERADALREAEELLGQFTVIVSK
jgi:hypothetical protein